MLSNLKIDVERCKACGCCIRECPAEALHLTQELNQKGYQVIAVDEEKCRKCGICYYMCPDCVFELEV